MNISSISKIGTAYLFLVEYNEDETVTAYVLEREAILALSDDTPYLPYAVATSNHANLEDAAAWCYTTEDALLAEFHNAISNYLAVA